MSEPFAIEPAAIRVQRGIVLLDSSAPEWRAKIAVARLDVAVVRDCPLGQVFGAYEKGLNMLWPIEPSATLVTRASRLESAIAAGFVSDCRANTAGTCTCKSDAAALNLAWTAALTPKATV